jgi:dephospho-CoA kinase
MKLSISVTVAATFVHKSGESFKVDKVVREEYNKGSEEYETLVEVFEEATGVKQNETTEEVFNKQLGLFVADEIRRTMKERIDKIMQCTKDLYMEHATRCIAEFGGWMFNMKDFSAVAFEDTKVNISYK